MRSAGTVGWSDTLRDWIPHLTRQTCGQRFHSRLEILRLGPVEAGGRWCDYDLAVGQANRVQRELPSAPAVAADSVRGFPSTGTPSPYVVS